MWRGSRGLAASPRHPWGPGDPAWQRVCPLSPLANQHRGEALRGPSGGERLRWVVWDRSLGERAPQMDNLAAPCPPGEARHP